jgi:hypothetical protein
MRWAGHVAHMVEMKNKYKMLVRKRTERCRPLGRFKHKWDGNFRIDLR